MRIALVASSCAPRAGAVERHAAALARGLASRGVDVELIAQDAGRGLQRVSEQDGVVIRRFTTTLAPGRIRMAPNLWDWLRTAAADFDLVDVHTVQAPLAIAARRAGFRRMVFTPHGPLERFIGWRYSRATRTLFDGSVEIVCNSMAERELIAEAFPLAAHRCWVAPIGIDTAAIRAASPFGFAGAVVLAIGHLERANRIDRAISAMASLDPRFRLVVIGDGPERDRLRAYAADLQVAARVEFVGSVTDEVLYRWLRTARVVVALPEHRGSRLAVAEALAAGAAVVASDIPSHHEVATQFGRGQVIFVSTVGSPIEVADAILEGAHLGRAPGAAGPASSRASALDFMCDLYERLLSGSPSVSQSVAGVAHA